MAAAKTRKILEAAMASHRHGDAVAAEQGYRKVLSREPANPDALQLLGTILAQKGDVDDGARLIARAIEILPRSKEAHLNLANLEARRMRFKEAESHFRTAHQLDVHSPEAANGLGGALLSQGQYGEAEHYLRRALEIQPQFVDALINLGTLMEATGRFTDGMALYDRALRVAPNHADAHQHKALALLLREQFKEGWPVYDWRHASVSTFFGRFAFPRWNGESLKDKKILIWTEQGPGEELLAGTMVPDILQRGARVVLLCSPRLAPLFRRSFPETAILQTGQKPDDPAVLAGVDFQASLSDLGKHLRTSASAFPTSNSYLKADPGRTTALRQKYSANAAANLLVGLSWRSRAQATEATKSLPLASWAPLLKQPGLTFVSLQYGPVQQDLDDVTGIPHTPVIHDTSIDPLLDMDVFASQVAAMDLVISVSNTTVHTAGALGVPTWAFIPSNHARLWYWFLERSRSLWYPSVRLFRQNLDTGWEGAVTAVATELATFRDHAASKKAAKIQVP